MSSRNADNSFKNRITGFKNIFMCDTNNISRRGFIKTGAVTVAALAMSQEKLQAAILGDMTESDGRRVVLKQNALVGVNTLTQEMFYQANTIYVVQYDFVLGENITMPSNCILLFEGGSIGGPYTLTGDNTGLCAGLVKIINRNISFAGTWNVDWAYPEWVGGKANETSIDNAVAINFLVKQGFPIRIPNNHYYCQSPIFLQDVPFTLDGILEYNGTRSGITFITFYRYGPRNHIALNGQIMGNEKIINFSKARNTNLVGIHFRSCNNNQVYIASVYYFNVGIKISDYDGIGCCYNQFYIGEIWNTNKAVLLTWGERGSHKGWVNENSFIGGRFSCYSSLKLDECYDFYVEIGSGAKYGGVDSLKVVRASFESNRRIPVHLEHCIDSSFIDCRTEDCSAFIEADSDCHNIYHRTLAGTNKCVPIDKQKGYQASTKESFKLSLPSIAIDDSDWVTVPLYYKRKSNTKTYVYFADGISLKGFFDTRYWIKFTKRYDPQKKDEVLISDAERASLPVFYDSYFDTRNKALITGGASACRTFSIPEFISEIQVKTLSGKGEVQPLKYDWDFKNWTNLAPKGVSYE